MKKHEFLKLVESIGDDDEIVFLDSDGNFSDELEIINKRVLGRFFGLNNYQTYEFYSESPNDLCEHLYDREVLVIG